MGWPVVMATGHKYRLHWGEAIDFEQMRVYISPLWQQDEQNVHIMTNFTDVRVAMNITTNGGRGDLIANETYLKAEEDLVSGDNVVYNQTEVREFNFVLNGKNLTDRSDLKIEGFRCVWDCEQEEIEEMACSDIAIPWSDVNSWPDQTLPVEGDEVQIPPGVRMQFDIEETPLLKSLTINGCLDFLNLPETPTNRTIHAYHVYVRQGNLTIGTEDEPYAGQAEIRLYGAPDSETLAFSVAVESYNKVLAIVGTAKFYG